MHHPGCAGTGKSLVLKRILARLAEAGITSGVYATATTGLAACHVKGSTLQQFAGIGKARGSGEEVLKVIKKRSDAVRRWKAARVRVGGGEPRIYLKKKSKYTVRCGGLGFIGCGDGGR